MPAASHSLNAGSCLCPAAAPQTTLSRRSRTRKGCKSPATCGPDVGVLVRRTLEKHANQADELAVRSPIAGQPESRKPPVGAIARSWFAACASCFPTRKGTAGLDASRAADGDGFCLWVATATEALCARTGVPAHATASVAASSATSNASTVRPRTSRTSPQSGSDLSSSVGRPGPPTAARIVVEQVPCSYAVHGCLGHCIRTVFQRRS